MKDTIKSIKLNPYTFFGYLLPGFYFLFLFLIDIDGTLLISEYMKNHIIDGLLSSVNTKSGIIIHYFNGGLSNEIKFCFILIFLLFCYLLGHLISVLSSVILERWFVKRFLKQPSVVLITPQKYLYKRKWYKKIINKCFPKKYKKTRYWKWYYYNNRRLLFPTYTLRLPFVTIRLLKRSLKIVYKDKKIAVSDYYQLAHAYLLIKQPVGFQRTNHFVTLYGFARNVTMAFFLYLIIRFCLCYFDIIKFPLNGFNEEYYILLCFTIMMFAMLYNYLKLYKRHTTEMFFLFIATVQDEEKARKHTLELMKLSKEVK